MTDTAPKLHEHEVRRDEHVAEAGIFENDENSKGTNELVLVKLIAKKLLPDVIWEHVYRTKLQWGRCNVQVNGTAKGKSYSIVGSMARNIYGKIMITVKLETVFDDGSTMEVTQRYELKLSEDGTFNLVLCR